MQLDRKTRLPASPPVQAPAPPRPIERTVETETIKVIKEKCLHCGAFVEFRVRRVNGDRRHVWCPKCGACFTQNVARDTIRPYGCAAPLNRASGQ